MAEIEVFTTRGGRGCISKAYPLVGTADAKCAGGTF